jgi:F-type H+-transporting ATPase subunit gamma
MSRRRELRQHLRALGEIKEILSSMKSLSVMETRKLARFGETQQRALAGIEQAAADFCRFFPEVLTGPGPLREVYLLLGSERGFCGDFNERLLDALQDLTMEDSLLLAVGSRLGPKLEGDPQLAAHLRGAGVTEEVPAILGQVVDTLGALERQYGPLGLTVLYHEVDMPAVSSRRLLPPFQDLAGKAPAFAHPPQLNLPARQFLPQLIDQYLFAALHAVFYAALMAENQRRVSHLEGAVRRLEEKLTRLEQRANALRQEEITEEIEVILLSTQAGRP